VNLKSPKMRIGYLMNIYPVTSATFIRREIVSLEEQGVYVHRFALRTWTEELVDPQDVVEQEKTTYLLSGRGLALIGDFFKELVANPKGVFRAMGLWARLMNNARAGFVRHVAYLLEAVSLKRHLLETDIDHVHAHYSTNTAAVAMLAEAAGGPGYSFTAHGPDEFLDTTASSLKLKVTKARFVAAITDYCRSVLTLAAGQGAWDKIKVVRCGVQTDAFVPTQAPFDGDAPFVCVGRLCPQKAQVLIVKAIGQIAKRYPNVRVVFIGDGESRADVEAEIKAQGVAAQVELLGWQSSDVVRERLGQAKALLLPSFAEGLPIVIMEAFALGRPVVSSYIAGIPELVTPENGWLVPASSVDAIAEAMEKVMQSSPEDLARMGGNGRSRVEAEHNVDENAAQLKSLFRDYISAG